MILSPHLTLYHLDFAKSAHNDCLLGATNTNLAGFFDGAPRTVDNWIATHDGFAAAVRQARAAADGFARIEFTTSPRVCALV